MATYKAQTMMNAKKKAAMMRKKGYKCSVYKMKKGYGVSVTRKK